jgi:malate permease and related proteins
MPLSIILNQIVILSILVIIGVIASKAKVITPVTKELLAKLIFNVTLPSMLLTNFSRIDLTPRLLSNSFQILLLSTMVLLFMLLAGWLTARIMQLKEGAASIFRVHSMLGNIIYLGLPVISALFGKEGLLYGSIFILVSNLLMWTVGVAAIRAEGNIFSVKNLMRILNINTISIITGFILFLFSVKLPKIVLDSLGGLGGTNTFLSMIYIGTVLYYANVRKMVNNRAVWVLSINRLLIVPALILGVFLLFNSIFPGVIDREVISVLVMQAAMPCMVNVVIMVNILGEDDGVATANVFVSTLLSILTLPLVLMSLSLLH